MRFTRCCLHTHALVVPEFLKPKGLKMPKAETELNSDFLDRARHSHGTCDQLRQKFVPCLKVVSNGSSAIVNSSTDCHLSPLNVTDQYLRESLPLLSWMQVCANLSRNMGRAKRHSSDLRPFNKSLHPVKPCKMFFRELSETGSIPATRIAFGNCRQSARETSGKIGPPSAPSGAEVAIASCLSCGCLDSNPSCKLQQLETGIV